jgi:hypothetical protein
VLCIRTALAQHAQAVDQFAAGTCMHGAVSRGARTRVLAGLRWNPRSKLQNLPSVRPAYTSSYPPVSGSLILREAARRVAPESSTLEWDPRSCSLTTVVGSAAQWLGPKASPTLSLWLCLSSPPAGTATLSQLVEKSSEQSVAHAQESTVPTGRVALRQDDGSDRIRRQCEQGWRGHRAGRCCS